MARNTVLLQWAGRDVGWFLRRLRPMGYREGASAASLDNRARRLHVHGPRLPLSKQHLRAVRIAVAYAGSGSRVSGQDFRARPSILAELFSRCFRERTAVSR